MLQAELSLPLPRLPSIEEVIEREIRAGQAFGPFHRKFILDHARHLPEQVRRNLELASTYPHSEILAANQSFSVPLVPVGGATANPRAAINTTITETNLWDPNIFAPIPALDMIPGKRYTVEFGGVMGTTATPAISFRARCGTNNSAPPTGTDLGVGPTVTLGTFTAQPFYGWFSMIVRAVGVAAAGATVTGNGYVLMPAAAAATTTPHAVIGGAVPTTVDHTIAQGLGVSVIWGTSSVSNTLTPQWVFAEST